MFAHDLIEINGGKCLKLSSRRFVNIPFKPDGVGKISPRLYADYTLGVSRNDGGFFSQSILNSFPDVIVRAEFLNKFYQCLLYDQLPHKTRKLVVVGTNNSGKSSWAKVFFGLLNNKRMASVTKIKNIWFAIG